MSVNLSIYLSALFRTLATVPIIALASCQESVDGSGGSDSSVGSAPVSAYDQSDRSPADTVSLQADRDWEILMSSGQAPDRMAGENSLAYFMRQVETANVRLRELGLEFWNNYPDDPRRYKWLQMTVHLPPSYPVDISDWAFRETQRGINTYEVDHSALETWEDTYGSLRASFWSADEVTETERRYLWAGEFEQNLRRMNAAHARGESVDVDEILEEILAFATIFQHPVDEYDRSAFGSDSATVIRSIVEDEYRPLFNWTDASILAYAQRLEATADNQFSLEALDNGIAVTQAWQIRQAGGVPASLLSTRSETESAWRSAMGFPTPALFSLESKIVHFHKYIVTTRRKQWIASQYIWNAYPDHLWRIQWLKYVNAIVTAYPHHFFNSIYDLSSGSDVGVDIQPDEDALREWLDLYSELRTEMWNHPDTTREQRGEILGAELIRTFDPFSAVLASAEIDSEIIERSLEEAQKLYEVYGNVTDTLRISGRLISEYRALGIDENQLISFFEPLTRSENEAIRNIALAGHEQMRLRTAPFEFQADTLDGASFDMAELRGDIVLVDHWGTNCASCIAAMPLINDVFEAYRDRGFSVVSIAYDATSKRRQVLRIKSELELDDWVSLDGEGQWEAVSQRYGYQGFPQYMLLNRDGTLFAGTGEVDLGRNLAALLDQMLAAEAEASLVAQ